MFASGTRVLAIHRLGFTSSSLWIPCMGSLWVITNIALMALAAYVAYPFICSITAGLLNGTILSIIVVARASDRLQAGTTGLLGGVSLSGLRNDGSLIWKATQNLHTFVDQALMAVGIKGNEPIHDLIQQHVLYTAWTGLFVVMASLIAEWVRKSRSEEAGEITRHP